MDVFTHKDVRPAGKRAEALAKAIISLVDAEQSLRIEKSKIPSYTGDSDPKDYYAQEQEERNRAADILMNAITDLILFNE